MSEDEAEVTRGDYRVRLAYDTEPEAADPRDADNVGVMWTRHRNYILGDNPGRSTRHNVTPGELLSVRGAHREMFPEWWELNEFIESIRDFPGITTHAIVKHLMRTGSTVVLPLYLYDHSGLAMSAGENLVLDVVGGGGGFVEQQGWDTSYVGFIFDTARTRAPAGRLDDDNKVEEILRAEVEAYSSYLEGDVWGYVVERHLWVRTITRLLTYTTREDVDDVVDEEHDEWDEVEAVYGFIGHEPAIEAAKEALDRFAPAHEKKEG